MFEREVRNGYYLLVSFIKSLEYIMKNTRKGFTLIELLVVIAIIGILSSVVLASLNTARGKGADASIKSNLAQIRAQAEIVYDGNTPNSYSGLCANVVVAAQTAGAASSLGGTVVNVLATAGTASTVVCHVDVTNAAWAVSSALKSNTANSWCVDSTGASKQITGAYLQPSIVVCP
jgi:prepilin-type N-terminal cleavage/methylation domain-containing protein